MQRQLGCTTEKIKIKKNELIVARDFVSCSSFLVKSSWKSWHCFCPEVTRLLSAASGHGYSKASMPPKHQWLFQILLKDWNLKGPLKTLRKARCRRRGRACGESPGRSKRAPNPGGVLLGRVGTPAGPTINLWVKVRVGSPEAPPVSAGVCSPSAGLLKFFPWFMVSVLKSCVSFVHFPKYFILFWCYGKWNFLNFFPDCSTNQFWLILLFRNIFYFSISLCPLPCTTLIIFLCLALKSKTMHPWS